MGMPAFLVTPDKNFQLFAGIVHLVGWLVLMPFLAAMMVRMVHSMNATIFGQTLDGQEAFLRFGKAFFASISFMGALYGAALLSVFFLAQSGLVKSPWE
jgi:hypothetical protein